MPLSITNSDRHFRRSGTLNSKHKQTLATITGGYVIPDLSGTEVCTPSYSSSGTDNYCSYSSVGSSNRHVFIPTPVPRMSRHKDSHGLLVDEKTALRHLSEADEEEEAAEGELDKGQEETNILNPSSFEEVHNHSDHHLSAHSVSVISNLMEKSDLLRRPISLMLPHARKVINWATRPYLASSVPYINFSKYFEEEMFNELGSRDYRLNWRPTQGPAYSPNRGANGFVEELPINKKPEGKLALGVPIPEDGGELNGENDAITALSRERRRGQYDNLRGVIDNTPVNPDPPHNFRSLGGKRNTRGDGGGSRRGGDISVSMMSTRSMIQGSVITFRDVEYVVPVRKMPCTKVHKKVVLNGVSGIMRPGVNAIMGPTGCGKSSLLDVLAGRKQPRYLTGEVLIDGHPQPKHFKCISGYVVQDDILMGTLTVRESLYLAAMLKRKKGFSLSETREKVNEILDELGLTKIADSKIGTELFRGISGGERKRTSIGMEIIADPSVLFLDEPTTGLDAFTAGSVIQTLKTLSRRGRTIILSIHQPRYSIYKLFDSLTLMSGGRIVYHGPARKEPVNYFSRLGYIIEDHNNPPDFFLDILHGEVKPISNPREKSEEFEAESDDSHERIRAVSDQLAITWSESAECSNIRNEVLTIQNRTSNTANYVKPESLRNIGYAASFPRQLFIVCWRTSLALIRDPQASIVQTLVYLFFAVAMGVVYFGLDTSLESGLQNRSGLFFFATLQVVFVNIGSIELFLKERAIFIHEHSSGYYRVSSYFLAKLICDVLPTKALPVLFFMPITYWMAKLYPDAGKFFFFEFILVLSTIAAAATAMAVSASVTLFSIANVIISILFVFMMVFGGFLINLEAMADWLSWLRYFSIFNYTFGGLLINEMSDLTFCPITNRSTPAYIDTRTCESGRVYLDTLGYANSNPWDLWLNVVGLCAITVTFFLLCYILLRSINTYK
nr:ATP binding cassette sub family G [Hymenolepis microstoma]